MSDKLNETFDRHLRFLRKKLNESMNEKTIKKTNYWLSPQGEFFKLDGRDDVAYLHGVVNFINKGEYEVEKDDRDGGLYLIDPETNDVMNDQQMYDVAYNKGWVSVSLDVGTNNSELIFDYGRGNGQKVNSNQLASLKRLASDQRAELIDGNTYETLDEAAQKHLGLLKNKLNEGWNDQEDKMLDYLQRLADQESDDFYDAMRDFQAVYGYRPSIRSRRSSYKPRPSLTGKTLYFYNVPSDKQGEAARLLKKTKSGKWYSMTPNPEADTLFGKGRPWTAK